jgi:hypothetical protein
MEWARLEGDLSLMEDDKLSKVLVGGGRVDPLGNSKLR